MKRLAALSLLLVAACQQSGAAEQPDEPAVSRAEPTPAAPAAPAAAGEAGEVDDTSLRRVVLAGGCFWCTEAVFEELRGVRSVVSGYAGGAAETADYKAVSAGRTDHAEVIQIAFDPAQVSYAQLLDVFFGVAHDPTQLNRQGPDRGRQYRSAVFFASEDEKREAEAAIGRLTESGAFDAPIVTTLEELDAFYPAEDYHQDYVRRNPRQPYVVRYALPKVEKVRKRHASLLKPREG